MPTLITQYYSADHDRLDVFYSAFKKALVRKEQDKAQEYFHCFYHGLSQHIRWEEDILFPALYNMPHFEYKDDIAIIQQEHELILKYINEIKINIPLQEDCLFLCSFLEPLMESHNHKEELILYPECDNICNLETLANTFSKMIHTGPSA